MVGSETTITARIAKVTNNCGVFGAPRFLTDHNAIASQQIVRIKIGGDHNEMTAITPQQPPTN